ncbi:hypothetical protein ASPBRDRAFT_211913 [Aspergillus brasiliensis CBS 101740]|uniref:Uncharacterized protein n=1 Tax=Aspergillus brasiliensis (strain CBS 101740 / IMI 381727 / IBT 21946) TaxID=767769 RepID=A0A1L9U1H3_ASPBC|nr:hypothetical protein ASPBRDRAFT_212075 [Aspergillus brasiliensis CBS 101740]OJJ65817.1 hypothetical protein ASPBRDRAFT_211913 [Aspergillus brasiliensis CBS 101740]
MEAGTVRSTVLSWVTKTSPSLPSVSGNERPEVAEWGFRCDTGNVRAKSSKEYSCPIVFERCTYQPVPVILDLWFCITRHSLTDNVVIVLPLLSYVRTVARL